MTDPLEPTVRIQTLPDGRVLYIFDFTEPQATSARSEPE